MYNEKEVKSTLEKCLLNKYYYKNNHMNNNFERYCDITDLIKNKIDSSLHRSERLRRIHCYG